MKFDQAQIQELGRIAVLMLIIAVAGFLGGAGAYGADLIGNEHQTFLMSRMSLQAALGAIAALFGVFLLANSDTSNAPSLVRAIVFAIACGATWQPILAATRALVGQQITTERATQQVTIAANAIESVPEAAGPQVKAALIQSSVETATQGLSDLAQLPTTSNTDQGKDAAIRVLENLNSEYEKTPSAFDDPKLKGQILQFQNKAVLAYPELTRLPANQSLATQLAKGEAGTVEKAVR
jgi:hypothetical protein